MAKLYGNYGPTAQTWPSIRKFYGELPKARIGPFQAFVEQIVNSPYPAAGLLGLTSMADLILGLNPSILDEPHLRIRYDRDAAEVLFAFPSGPMDTPTKGAKWVRKVPADKAFVVLERFLLKGARWFRAGLSSPPASGGP